MNGYVTYIFSKGNRAYLSINEEGNYYLQWQQKQAAIFNYMEEVKTAIATFKANNKNKNVHFEIIASELLNKRKWVTHNKTFNPLI